MVCLDAECSDYRRVWCTTSLRGNLTGRLRVRVLTEGVHSGMGTGIAATPVRIAQQLLARLEDPATGEVLLKELNVEVPPDRRAQIAATAWRSAGIAARTVKSSPTSPMLRLYVALSMVRRNQAVSADVQVPIRSAELIFSA